MGGYASRGPNRKRDAERQRTNDPTVTTTKIVVAELIAREVEIPTPDEEWHPIARRWYDSLSESAQCVYYEPTDWMTAYVQAETLSRGLKPQVIAYDEEEHKIVYAVRPLKGTDINALIKTSTNLLMTEVDRRRAGIEIEREVQLRDLEQGEGDAEIVDFETARRADVG